jgi:hypothetical protein
MCAILQHMFKIATLKNATLLVFGRLFQAAFNRFLHVRTYASPLASRATSRVPEGLTSVPRFSKY